MLKKTITVILLIFTVFALTGCEKKERNTFTGTEIPIYYKTPDNADKIEVFYKNNNNQIPYISPDTWVKIANRIYHEGNGDYPEDPDYMVTTCYNNDKVTFIRENGTEMVLDFTKNTVTFDNFDRFISHSYDVSIQELPHMTGYDEDGRTVYIERVEEKYVYTNPSVYTLDLNLYNIDIYYENNRYYIPLQTMADLLIGLQYSNILYNTQAVFVLDNERSLNEIAGLNGLIGLYYEDSEEKRSTELIEFTYNELCLLFDFSYGLKEEHMISDFDTYFQNTVINEKTLKDYLLSDDAYEYELGIFYFLKNCLNDLHSQYYTSCAYSGNEGLKIKKEYYHGISYEKITNVYARLLKEQETAYPDGVPGYEEIGNTAFIYFRSFEKAAENYYEEEPTAGVEDTIGLMIYAYNQIYRENSPVENVILDLSFNTGGFEDAICYVAGMFTGEFAFSIVNPITGANSTSVYRIDANLDHICDDKDWFYDKHLYCITSAMSFSCANLAPMILDENTNVTILGRDSLGGACVLLPFTTASGGWYVTSGTKKLVRNHLGSYYNIDCGVEVDYRFDTYEKFYDREWIVSFINGLQ